MRRRHDQHPDDSLRAWQEWMSRTPGSWRSGSRIPPIGQFGRRPTGAGLLLVAVGLTATFVRRAAEALLPAVLSRKWV